MLPPERKLPRRRRRRRRRGKASRRVFGRAQVSRRGGRPQLDAVCLAEPTRGDYRRRRRRREQRPGRRELGGVGYGHLLPHFARDAGRRGRAAQEGGAPVQGGCPRAGLGLLPSRGARRSSGQAPGGGGDVLPGARSGAVVLGQLRSAAREAADPLPGRPYDAEQPGREAQALFEGGRGTGQRAETRVRPRADARWAGGAALASAGLGGPLVLAPLGPLPRFEPRRERLPPLQHELLVRSRARRSYTSPGRHRPRDLPLSLPAEVWPRLGWPSRRGATRARPVSPPRGARLDGLPGALELRGVDRVSARGGAGAAEPTGRARPRRLGQARRPGPRRRHQPGHSWPLRRQAARRPRQRRRRGGEAT
mmetsp:Transcript_2648/g.5862  ORF Transcript_2648/g.5862 Transcript_2648/m.5862 type:complete len:365 (+) Transcript_2648:2765-3859(+)